MIYVAVGTQKFQFDRLLKTIDNLISNGVITEEVFAQTGNCIYKPVNYSYKEFLSKEEFDNYIHRCDLLITHSGVATIIAGLRYNKPVIVMPRIAKLGEHVDDHQVQIADSFAGKNFILKCDKENNLGTLIDEAKVHEFDEYVSQRERMVNTIRKYISSI
jgi:Uncharacterized conserved protein